MPSTESVKPCLATIFELFSEEFPRGILLCEAECHMNLSAFADITDNALLSLNSYAKSGLALDTLATAKT